MLRFLDWVRLFTVFDTFTKTAPKTFEERVKLLFVRKWILEQCLIIAQDNLIKHPEYQYFPHFSFVVADNKIIEWGVNRTGDGMTLLGYRERSKIHAEVNAFKKAKGLLKGQDFEMVNIRLTRGREVKCAKPCECCHAFLRALNCKAIYYSTESGWSRA